MSDERPTRLRDDPEFLALAGLRFEDEVATLPEPDLAAGQARLSAAIDAGAETVLGHEPWLATTGAKASLAVVAVVAAAGFALWPSGSGGPDTTAALVVADAPEEVATPQAPEAQVAEPVEAAPQPAPPEAVVQAPQPEPPAAEVPEAERTPKAPEPEPAPATVSKRQRKARAAPAPRAKAPPALSEAPVKVDERVAPGEAPTSTLPAQLALYDEGKRALAAGDHAAAIAAFKAYGSRYPGGSLRREARLSLLEALVRGGRMSQARGLARKLLQIGGLGKRKGDVRRVLGEMQARLGQCDDAAITLATALTEGASGLSVATVEAAVAHCRKTQEEQP